MAGAISRNQQPALLIRPWWRTDEKGQVVLFAGIGRMLIEFEKGKMGMLIPTDGAP